MKRIPIQLKSSPGEGVETKQVLAKLEVKAEGEGGILHIKAYGLAFGNIDSWGDIIMPNACDEFLKSDDAARMALCWQHDRSTVIGIITDKGVDDYGMWIEADILPTTAGRWIPSSERLLKPMTPGKDVRLPQTLRELKQCEKGAGDVR